MSRYSDRGTGWDDDRITPNRVIRESGRWSSPTIVVATIALVTLIVIATMWMFGWGIWQKETANFRGSVEQTEKVRGDGDYRIAKYDHFHDLCQSIVAKEGDIAATKASLETADETQRYYDQQNLRAMEANRRQLISQYNADAAKTATAGQFRDSNLPAHIDPTQETTTCAN